MIDLDCILVVSGEINIPFTATMRGLIIPGYGSIV
jgi:hypothetical protein